MRQHIAEAGVRHIDMTAQQRGGDLCTAGEADRFHPLHIDAAGLERPQHRDVVVAGGAGAAEGERIGRFAQSRQKLGRRAQR